jgi:hypothetical protein
MFKHVSGLDFVNLTSFNMAMGVFHTILLGLIFGPVLTTGLIIMITLPLALVENVLYWRFVLLARK